MPRNDSQTPDALDIELLFKRLSRYIPRAAASACRFYDHPTNWGEIEDLSQDIRILLSKDNCEKLRSYNHGSSPETWLYTVVRRHVGRYLQRQRKQVKTVRLEELSPDSLKSQPIQEETLISEDERTAFWAFVRSLPAGKQRLVGLALQGLEPKEMAEEMGIKINSVYQERYDLKKELLGFLEGRGIILPDLSLEEILEIFFR